MQKNIFSIFFGEVQSYYLSRVVLKIIKEKLLNKMIKKADRARQNAYAPYSDFQVGASVLGADGIIYSGCNVENISLGLTICAERNAVFSAVAAGCQDISVLVVISDSSPPATPCGACRQVLVEFANNLEIIITNLKNETKRYDILELFPEPFARENDYYEL